jgi:uncharacterized protein YidB (DUF937 family)
MNILDQLKDQLSGILAAETAGAEGAQAPPHDPHAMLESVMGLISQHGGLSAFLEKLKAGGLGDAVSSWIATGDNRAVSNEQVASAVGSDAIDRIAAKLGTTNENAASLLSKYLPMVIDRLTPNGKIEESGILAKGLEWLKSQAQGAAAPKE